MYGIAAHVAVSVVVTRLMLNERVVCMLVMRLVHVEMTGAGVMVVIATVVEGAVTSTGSSVVAMYLTSVVVLTVVGVIVVLK